MVAQPKVGRQRQDPDVRRDELSPSKRDFLYVGLRPELAKKFTAYREAHHLKQNPDVVAHLLDAVESPKPPVVPWEDIRSALLDEFGLIHKQKVDAVIERLKTAQQ